MPNIGKRATRPQITLDQAQANAMGLLEKFINDPSRTAQFKLGGYAGTGKTTLIRELVEKHPGSYGISSFTGKAVSVLRKKGLEGALTLHSLMYRPFTTSTRLAEKGKVSEGVNFVKVPELPIDMVIVDEASMVSGQLYRDLTSFPVKVLWVGDPGQLEPIGDDDPGLMKTPDFTLTQIHRQAANSQILVLADQVRRGMPVEIAVRNAISPNSMVKHISRGTINDHLMEVDQVICGYNKTRVFVNNRIREKKGFKDPLCVGEKLICLQNNTKIGVFNGMTFRVESLRKLPVTMGNIYECKVLDDLDNAMYIKVWLVGPDEKELKIAKQRARSMEIAICDYGYCITCHKAQGSEWPSIMVINESKSKLWQASRWFYTAATRAGQELRVLL